MTTRVKCTVDTCHYWGQGHVCEANEIEVNNNHSSSMGMTRTAFTNASDISATGHSRAQSSSETMCETYRPRSSSSNR